MIDFILYISYLLLCQNLQLCRDKKSSSDLEGDNKATTAPTLRTFNTLSLCNLFFSVLSSISSEIHLHLHIKCCSHHCCPHLLPYWLIYLVLPYFPKSYSTTMHHTSKCWPCTKFSNQTENTFPAPYSNLFAWF